MAEESGDGKVVNDQDNDTGKIRTVDVHDPASLQGFIERKRDRQEAYNRFHEEFQQGYGGVLHTTITNEGGLTEEIEIFSRREEPQIAAIQLDEENPVKFYPTKYSISFHRKELAVSPQPTTDKPETENDIFEILSTIDFSVPVDDEENSLPTVADADRSDMPDEKTKQEAILHELQNKFAALGLANIPIPTYAHRLVGQSQRFIAEEALAQAKMILPRYREVEIKRLLALEKASLDSHAPEYSLELVLQRQHLYNQLTHLLRDSGMDASDITEYMMKGLFDGYHIAGVPIFTDEHGDHYVAIDYAFGGYDEQKPEDTNFSGGYEARDEGELMEIFDRAEKKFGYTTHYENSGVDGGTHQHWNWHGIKIDDFDTEHPENNVAKVVKILEDVGINPEEAADARDAQFRIMDLYIR